MMTIPRVDGVLGRVQMIRPPTTILLWLASVTSTAKAEHAEHYSQIKHSILRRLSDISRYHCFDDDSDEHDGVG
jgi:hypothetical protein